MKRINIDKIKSLESAPQIVNIFSIKEIKLIQELYDSLPETVFNKKQNVKKKKWIQNYNKELDQLYFDKIRNILGDFKLKSRLWVFVCKLEIEKMQLLHLRDLNLMTTEIHGLNKILATKNSRIEELERIVEDANDSWAIPVVGIASFILGVTITVGITYAVNR
mgnify:CR=1 FL=1